MHISIHTYMHCMPCQTVPACLPACLSAQPPRCWPCPSQCPLQSLRLAASRPTTNACAHLHAYRAATPDSWIGRDAAAAGEQLQLRSCMGVFAALQIAIGYLAVLQVRPASAC